MAPAKCFSSATGDAVLLFFFFFFQGLYLWAQPTLSQRLTFKLPV